MHVHIHRAKIQTMKQSVGPRHSQSELTLALVLGQASETPTHKPGINPVMTRYLGSRVVWVQGEGQRQQGVLGELRVVALCKPAQTYFNILTSTAIAICVGEAQTHVRVFT